MRIIIFIGLLVLSLFVPFWIFLPFVFLYALWQSAYELIILGMFIDAQFGLSAVSFGYLYTFTLGTIVLVAEFIKPHMSFYNE